jgi:hypothetical protein
MKIILLSSVFFMYVQFKISLVQKHYLVKALFIIPTDARCKREDYLEKLIIQRQLILFVKKKYLLHNKIRYICI